MHKKHASAGLVLISVSLDALEKGTEEETKQRVKAFLRKAGATSISNLLLDEATEFWQDKLRFIAPPAYYVFNRQGKWVQFKSDKEKVDYQELEKVVVDFLKVKP
jgi:hypothetical protein